MLLLRVAMSLFYLTQYSYLVNGVFDGSQYGLGNPATDQEQDLENEKYGAACPDYQHYAAFPQQVSPILSAKPFTNEV